MTKFIEIAGTGVTAILLHPWRSAVTAGAVTVVLLPYLVCLGLSHGLRLEAESSIQLGADLYVSGIQFGHKVPIPLVAKSQIERIDGVTEVVPRIVGAIAIGRNRESAVVVGMPVDRFATGASFLEGRLPGQNSVNELVLGSELAHRLNLKLDSRIPPFYQNAQGEKVSSVVGIFRPDAPVWQANLILTTLTTAAAIFNQEGLVNDFLVYCRPGYEDHVRAKVLETVSYRAQGSSGGPRPMVIQRTDLTAVLPTGLLGQQGVFELHFVLVFAVGILVVLVTSGLGLSERRREIGILKATGWQTDEILFRSLVEGCLLSLAAAALAIVLGLVWLRVFNGFWIAGVFLYGAGVSPAFRVPFVLAPAPALLTVLIALVVVMTGSIYSTWRAATASPAEAMR
ncbi:MAG: FtsX-like permease family protein [Planctomycetes bacterium]|nr:FtsX-like permease family protein [Planctomycetota bacterium]